MMMHFFKPIEVDELRREERLSTTGRRIEPKLGLSPTPPHQTLRKAIFEMPFNKSF